MKSKTTLWPFIRHIEGTTPYAILKVGKLKRGMKRPLAGREGAIPAAVHARLNGGLLIISHKYRFVFIKTYKTAGTSIEVFLSQRCGSLDTLTPVSPHVEPHHARNYKGIWNPIPEMLENIPLGPRRVLSPLKSVLARRKFYNHIPARLVRHRTPERVWANYFKFCVERNPWDKTLSHYHMINDRAGGGISFAEYLSEGKFCLNLPHYADVEGNVLVDRILRYEFLMEELGEVFSELGVEFHGTLGVRAKSHHRQDRRPYQELYTPYQRRLIERAFAEEISMHGYSFD